jgi:membrane fusion protein, copper/silver efflux system
MKNALIVMLFATVACGTGSGGIGAVSCGAGGGTAAPASGSQMPASIIDPYLKVQTALAQDRVDGVKASAGEIATAATALGAPAMKIDTAAVQLTSASDVADARQKFGTLSDAVIAYMDGLHLKAPDGVRTAYCPMARKSWLQRGDTLANPYYGSSMPTCGEFK